MGQTTDLDNPGKSATVNICNLITYAKTFFPLKLHLQVPGIKTRYGWVASIQPTTSSHLKKNLKIICKENSNK